MAQVHDTWGAKNNNRRAPTAHSEAVQEAKRQEKMQSHSSSHRASGPTQMGAAPAKPSTD